MKIKSLWIVTKPTPLSELADIVFEADMRSLELQFRGGLTANQVHAAYTSRKEAHDIGRWLLHLRDTEQERIA